MTKYKQSQITKKMLIIVAAVVTMSNLTFNLGIFNQTAKADIYEEKIKKLRETNQYYESQAYELRQKADTLQGEVDFINQQKAQIQSAIDKISARIAELNQEIAQLEKAIEDNREALGSVLTKIYLAGEVSTIERLASSRAITDFIDEEAKNQSLRQSISTKLSEIKTQREEVTAKKTEQETALADQKVQMAAQQKLEAEKQKILDQTRGDENTYRQMTANNNAQIEALRLEQKKTNCQSTGGTWLDSGTCYFAPSSGVSIPAGVPGGGGYPGKWANAPLDAYVDPWGLYTRECVSYVAWKVYSTGRFVPHFAGQGNANQWPATTSRHGIAQGSSPKVGAAAVSMAGRYGHVMYVEAVHGDGTITVSDYNLMWDGLYRIYRRSASGLVYIYF